MPYTFRCADAGCACAATWTASNPDQIVAQVATHLQQQHSVKTISNTLVNFVKSAIKTTK